MRFGEHRLPKLGSLWVTSSVLWELVAFHKSLNIYRFLPPWQLVFWQISSLLHQILPIYPFFTSCQSIPRQIHFITVFSLLECLRMCNLPPRGKTNTKRKNLSQLFAHYGHSQHHSWREEAIISLMKSVIS